MKKKGLLLKEKLWAIYSKGDENNPSGFCFWNRYLEAYETRKEALEALTKEAIQWQTDKSKFKIVRVELKKLG